MNPNRNTLHNPNAMQPHHPNLTYGDSPASGPAPHTAGHHRHDLLNKIDPSVDSSRDKVPLPPPGGATNGPHSSRLANKLDPRVDTRAYEASNAGFGAGAGYAAGGTMMGSQPVAPMAPMHHSAGGGASAGMMSGGLRGEAPEGTYGPHSSRMANAVDPRVDSDRDGRGAMQHGAGGGYQQHGMGGGGYGQQQHAPQQSGFASRPHEGVGAAGYGQLQQHQGYGMGHGQHAGQHYGASALPGPAPNTAGPHRSDLLNKLDPTVDSKGGMGMMNERGQRRGL